MSYKTNPEQSAQLRHIAAAAMFTAVAVLLAPVFSIPFGVTKAFPIQHMINIFLSVFLGTRYSVSSAFLTSLIRNVAGTGTILAFPGSMIGAFLSGILYRHTHKLYLAVLGEFVGTSIIGGALSYPLAALLLGSSKGAFFYISVFAISCGTGCVIAAVVLKVMEMKHILVSEEK